MGTSDLASQSEVQVKTWTCNWHPKFKDRVLGTSNIQPVEAQMLTWGCDWYLKWKAVLWD